MPVRGGSSDKLGNRYEILWAIDQLLQIIDGAALELTLEPLDPDESRGIEFVVAHDDGVSYYWSVKRQTTKAAGWTLGTLTTSDDRGRSILGDLLRHVEKSPNHRGVFASTLGARDFEELRDHAGTQELLKVRLDQSAELKAGFDGCIMPLCGSDFGRARDYLLRTQTHAADEAHLRDQVNFKSRKLLYASDGSVLDVGAVRGHLTDCLLDNIHRPIRRDKVLKAMAAHGIRLRDWAIEKSVQDRIKEVCEQYTAPLKAQRINGTLLSLSAPIFDAGGRPEGQRILIVSGAGGGKSTTLAGAVEDLRDSGTPVLPIRFDQLPEGILSTTELGRKLLLPESPAFVLEGVARGRTSVLVLDQLDAVSTTAGRLPELWSLFDSLCREAAEFPSMSVVVGCREFDLEHDTRLRAMKSETSGFRLVKLKPLPSEQVDSVLRDGGLDPAALQSTFKDVLSVPLHLSMFLGLPADDRVGVGSREQLFDAFWSEAERRTGRRLGRKVSWTQVIDKLANWLSENQQLSAPRYVLDEESTDAETMASEHVLVLAGNRYRFFHESFFDYAFARRFAAKGGRLVDLLVADDQHLFRRAQVRQVLSYLRANDLPRYLEELRSVLNAAGFRFHIKRALLEWLSALPDPCRQEWGLLQELVASVPELRSHARGAIWTKPAWFAVMDSAGFFDAALASGDEAREQEAVWILSLRSTLELRSHRVAELLQQYRKSNESWNRYLHQVCSRGDVYHSREMFDFFLSLIDDGTLDGARPGFAVNDDWWSVLYGMTRNRPDLACETIARWFDRALVTWQGGEPNAIDSSDVADSAEWSLRKHLDSSGNGAKTILDAAKSSRSYAEHMLLRVASYVDTSARESGDHLKIDPLWSFRFFGSEDLQIACALLSGLAASLEDLARTSPDDLDRLLAPYVDRPHDTIAYLVLRAWTAAPDRYADHLADYLSSDPRRLKVGYACWSGVGSAANYISAQAVAVATSRCSDQRFMVLEEAILSLTDKWEAKHPKARGQIQLELLESVEGSRLSTLGRSRLDELRRKFPEVKHDPPEAMGAGVLGPPISEDALARMSDEQWMRALKKYTGVGLLKSQGGRISGGERELAMALQGRAKLEPARFSALAKRMPDDLPPTYFDAVIRGVADCAPGKGDAKEPPIQLEQLTALVRRVHSIPNRPVGRSIAWLFEKWGSSDWPADVVKIVAWYAMNDPDPDRELWKVPATGDVPYYGGEPHDAGINSARGAIAGAVARLLFDKPERFELLRDAVDSLAHDQSIAVRSCAIKALLAVLSFDVPRAIGWFKDCVKADSIVLETPYADQFLHYAVYRDYAAVRPVVKGMLSSQAPKAIEAAARQVCLAALDIEAAESDAERVRGGSSVMRMAAAHVYSTNVAHDAVGASCLRLLKPFFADPAESVRAKAASAFRELANLTTSDQSALLEAFLEGPADKAGLREVLRVLEQSPVQLPDLVCRLAEVCIEKYREEAGDISTSGPGVAMNLSKVVVRLYAQTEDSEIKLRCLNLIDEMERHHFMGLSSELQRLDR